ncbi:uncharacterized protein LOC120812167 isoform X1 [Gasterosteus aculeatus]
MLCLDFFHFGGLMLCSTGLCVALLTLHGQQLIPTPNPTVTETSSAATVSHIAPCFADEISALLREAVGSHGELAKRSRTQFGICTVSNGSSGSVLLQLAKETSRYQTHILEALHPIAAVLIPNEDERGPLMLTFDLPQSLLLRRSPVLLLTFESPPNRGNLDVTFTSKSLHPHDQTACISGETCYIMLTGKTSESNISQKWKISVETKSPDMNQRLKRILTDGRSGTNISVVPLLLFSLERVTSTRYHQNSSMASSQTSFLCELKRFLGDILPQDHHKFTPLKLDSLQSLPSLTLGLSSSDTMLAGLINSSSITIFSFSSWASMFPVHRGELSLSAELLEELRQRLEVEVVKITTVMREEQVGQRANDRLGRLRELSAFPVKEPAAGVNQYRAFLLLKALQMVSHAYAMQRGLRTNRASSNYQESDPKCRLKSLSVNPDNSYDLPNTVKINNCHGTCAFPLTNGTNHAVLLMLHVENGDRDNRMPCCVPVAYEDLAVVRVNENETYISIKPDMVAKECGCR